MERGAASRDALTAHPTRKRHRGTVAPWDRGTDHAPNITRWRVGDAAIHDAEAKLADMLMATSVAAATALNELTTHSTISGLARGGAKSGEPLSSPCANRVDSATRTRRSDHPRIVSLITSPAKSSAAAILPQRQVVNQ